MKEYIIPRIGHGYDVHRLTEDRELILGGVKIDYTLGLLGHSDADVLTHAVMDALLGAAALGDIGLHFPDTDPRYVGADSLLLRAGETVPVHEFHYWDSTENGAAFNAQKPATGRSWTCGFAGPALYAAFPHLYFAGRPQLAERFVRAAAAFQSGR